jgi:hypothetical protein
MASRPQLTTLSAATQQQKQQQIRAGQLGQMSFREHGSSAAAESWDPCRVQTFIALTTTQQKAGIINIVMSYHTDSYIVPSM